MCIVSVSYITIVHVFFHFSMAQQFLVGYGLPVVEASRSHSDTPHSVGLFWTSDQPVAETSTWQHKALTRYRLHAPFGIRTRNPSKRAAANAHLQARSHRHRRSARLRVVMCQQQVAEVRPAVLGQQFNFRHPFTAKRLYCRSWGCLSWSVIFCWVINVITAIYHITVYC